MNETNTPQPMKLKTTFNPYATWDLQTLRSETKEMRAYIKQFQDGTSRFKTLQGRLERMTSELNRRTLA